MITIIHQSNDFMPAENAVQKRLCGSFIPHSQPGTNIQ